MRCSGIGRGCIDPELNQILVQRVVPGQSTRHLPFSSMGGGTGEQARKLLTDLDQSAMDLDGRNGCGGGPTPREPAQSVGVGQVWGRASNFFKKTIARWECPFSSNHGLYPCGCQLHAVSSILDSKPALGKGVDSASHFVPTE